MTEWIRGTEEMASENEQEVQHPAVWTVRQGRFAAAVFHLGYEVNRESGVCFEHGHGLACLHKPQQLKVQ